MNAIQSIALRRLTVGLPPTPKREPTEEEIMALTIGGEVFLVDLGDYHLDGMSLGAVVRWDGSIGLEYVRRAESKTFHTGERAGFYNVVPSSPSRSQESHACVILGKVINRD